MPTTTPPATARPALIRTGVLAALGALPMVGQLYIVLPLAAEIGALPGELPRRRTPSPARSSPWRTPSASWRSGLSPTASVHAG